MTNNDILKQTVQSSRSIFESNFNTCQSYQDQAEKIVNAWLDQTPWVNQELRNTLVKWTESYRNGQNHLKTAIDTNFNTLEGFLTAS